MSELKRLGALEGLPEALTLLVARDARGQKEIALEIGIAPPSLSRILTGRNRPTAQTLGLLLEALGCSLWDLAAALDEVAGRKSPPRLDGPVLLAVFPAEELFRSAVKRITTEVLAEEMGGEEEDSFRRVVYRHLHIAIISRRILLHANR